jgi:hypothetical protein
MKPNIAVLKPKTQFPFEKLEQTAEVYVTFCTPKTALAALMAFEIPQSLSRNRKRTLDLKKQIPAIRKGQLANGRKRNVNSDKLH